MHPIIHAQSAARKFGGKWEDYIDIENWFDFTKSYIGHSKHRLFRHHSEGIFEMEKIFGPTLINSDGITVYTRYVGELHVKEDCNGKIPSAKEWINNLNIHPAPEWMRKTLPIED